MYVKYKKKNKRKGNDGELNLSKLQSLSSAVNYLLGCNQGLCSFIITFSVTWQSLRNELRSRAF